MYRTRAASGWLHTVALSAIPTPILQVEASGGFRQDTPTPGTASAAIANRMTVHWLELNADLSLGRSWYALLSMSRERGGWEGSDQMYSALTYRF
jgi:hypothetical protein